MKSGLYLVGTPIGNLADLSPRAVETLRAADRILAEDTRHTRNLLSRHQARGHLISCHQFNEASRVPAVLDWMRQDLAVALVTNAGMPAVSDPGARMVAACRKAGFPVTVIPGPSAVTAAVALCGFGGGGFLCEGFLPRKAGARRRRLEELRALTAPVVLFESPYRCLDLLAEIGALLPQRELFLARELTKINEECLWGTAAELAEILSRRANPASGRTVKGEIVLVLAPAAKTENRAAAPAEALKPQPAATVPAAGLAAKTIL